MPEIETNSEPLRSTDIVFDCPYCGKSLAIDYHGAGLTISCTDCGKEVVVPIPEGMDIVDIDSSEEEREIRILNLRRSLAVAEGRIASLELRLDEALAANALLTDQVSDYKSRYEAFGDNLSRLRDAHAEMTDALEMLLPPEEQESGDLQDEGESPEPEDDADAPRER